MNKLKEYLEYEIQIANEKLNSNTLDNEQRFAVGYHLRRCEDALVNMSRKKPIGGFKGGKA